MTKIQLKAFKTRLIARQRELEGLVRNREAAAIETSADAIDQIQQAVERELALGTLARESSGLRETRAALRRIDGGIFGICFDREEESNLKRLAALPWAARCVTCQEQADREGRAIEKGEESPRAEAA